jgi:lactate dehydrogenase-like 2-hydroxyacid dehydrogenase
VLRAALDVFSNEPEIHPSLKDDYRVVSPKTQLSSDCQILSPHCAAAPGPDFARIMNTEVVQNIIVYLTTGKPQSAVNFDAVQKGFEAKSG